MKFNHTGADERRTLSLNFFKSKGTTRFPAGQSGQLGSDELRRLVATMVD